MGALTDENEIQPERTPEWNIPRDAVAFLEWLGDSGIRGEDDAAKVAAFMELPAAAEMPIGLRVELRELGLLR